MSIHYNRSHLSSKGGKPKSQQALNRRGKVAKRKVVKRKISRLDLAKSIVAGGDVDSPAETKEPLKGDEKDGLSSKSTLDKVCLFVSDVQVCESLCLLTRLLR